MKEKIKATVVNTSIENDIKKDFENIKNTIIKCKESHIIVFSETCLAGFENESQHNEILEELSGISKENNIIIVIGMDETIAGTKYNSAYLFEDGKYNVYNKVHLVYDEIDEYEAGDYFPVFQTKLGKIGLMICYDIIFPETARCLRLNGTEIICLLSQWEKLEESYWDIVTRVRAKENWVYLLASDDTNKGCGKSCIIDPHGQVIASTEKNKVFQTITKTLDGSLLDKLNTSEKFSNWTKLRQPKKYRIIGIDENEE